MKLTNTLVFKNINDNGDNNEKTKCLKTWGNIPGGNFPRGDPPGGNLMDENFPGGSFPGGSFPDTPLGSKTTITGES